MRSEYWLLIIGLATAGYLFKKKLWVIWCGCVLVMRGLKGQVGPMVDVSVFTRHTQPCQRALQKLPPHLDGVVRCATQHAPCFAVSHKNIAVLSSPNEFYESVLTHIASAKHRVVIAALYLGVTEKCKKIADTLHTVMEGNASLKVTFLVDYGRGLRMENGVSVMTLLTPLVKKFGPQRVKVSMFMVPLCGAIFRHAPAAIREIAGVQHIKGVICDDSTLLTGANLNDDYFTNRMDRYIWLHNEPRLADWTTRFVHTLCDMSYVCLPSSDGDIVPSFPSSMSHPIYSGPSPSRVHEFSEDLSRKILELLEYREEEGEGEEKDTFVIPLTQLAAVGVRHESETVEHIVRGSAANVTISSAYPNYHAAMASAVNESSCGSVTFINPHESANGFFGAKGPKALVPLSYSYLLSQFTTHITHKVETLMWAKEKHTFHVKGLWVPNGTLIGSSNFGYRSRYLDAEMSMLILTTAPSLATEFDKEREAIIADTTRFERSELCATHTWGQTLTLKAITGLLFPFL